MSYRKSVISNKPTSSGQIPIYYKIAFAVVLLLVMVNVFTPLRLNTDGIRYLNILEYLQGGLDVNSNAAHDFLPHGYPWFLLLLDRLHLLGPVSITAINIISILAGSYLVARLMAIKNVWLYLSLVLLCFVCVKHYTLSITDEVFTLIFISAIYCWSVAFKGRRCYIIPALLLSVLSIFFRTAGISIFAGIFLYGVYYFRGYLFRHKAAIIFLVVLLVGGVVLFALNVRLLENHIDYVKQLDLASIANKPTSIISRLSFHLQEMGEIAINTPFSKLSGILGNGVLYLFIGVGIACFIVLIKIIANHKLYNHFSFWVFASYMVMILLWPFYDTRFLIPIIPFLVYFFMEYLFMLKRKYIALIAGAIYIIFGLFSVAYSDALSVNKAFFLAHYGADPNLTANYRTHFENEKKGPSRHPQNTINDNDQLFLLDKYDRRLLK